MATATRGRLALAQESRVQLRREQEYKDDRVKKYYTEQRNFDAAARDALKAPVKRREREAKERQAEIDMLESMYRTQKQQELAQLRTTEENVLATAVLDEHAKEQRERGEIAELHAKHETLRDLASKLKTAQVSRERHLQLQEKTILENQSREYDNLFADKLEKERQQAIIAEDEKQHLRRMDNFKAREKLEEQMEDRRKLEEMARAEFERDRELVDAVMAAIEEEDRLHGELKRAKAAETRRYITDFIADRDARREAERRAEFENERKIQEHLQEVKRREEAQQAALAAKREEADRIYTRLKEEKEAAQAAQDEQDFLVNLLRQEEVEARQRQKEQDMQAYRARIKKEMIAANQRQMELKAAAQAAAAAEDERMKQAMLAKFAEDDRLEQMNAQKRRMRSLEHRKEAERMIAEKRVLFEKAQREEAAAEAARIAREERELSLVERERRRLLREATDLFDYLPKGVLRNRDDLDYMLSLAQELKQKGQLT